MKQTCFYVFLLCLLSGQLIAQTAQDSVVVSTDEDAVEQVPASRNTTIVGYQIGGHNLIGVDYEIRLHDSFGIHFGAGMMGYTAGIKIHSRPSKNSSFFNLSFKDSGMGQFQTVGVEYGGKWVFNKSKSDFGLVYQIGIAAITTITDEFKEIMYPDVDTPPATLTMGIGFGF